MVVDEQEEKEIDEDFFPTDPLQHTKQHDCISFLVSNEDILSYMDLTGQFPHTSRRGNKYIVVCYNFHANAILVEPIPN